VSVYDTDNERPKINHEGLCPSHTSRSIVRKNIKSEKRFNVMAAENQEKEVIGTVIVVVVMVVVMIRVCLLD
jgi:hypothetical protein